MGKMPKIIILEEILMQMEKLKPWYCSFFDNVRVGEPMDFNCVPKKIQTAGEKLRGGSR